MKKGQGTFEYVLLLAGVLLIVVLAIVLLRGGIFGAGAKDVAAQACKRELAQAAACYEGSVWMPQNSKPYGDSCKAFKTNYPNSVNAVGSCPATTTPGYDFDEVLGTDTEICCGNKPG